MTGGPDYNNSARKRLNEASRFWAARNSEPWTEEEDDFLLHEWVMLDPVSRSEVECSQLLERTIEACRVRAEHIRKRLGLQVFEVKKRTIVEVTEVCPDCWLVHPTGRCDR